MALVAGSRQVQLTATDSLNPKARGLGTSRLKDSALCRSCKVQVHKWAGLPQEAGPRPAGRTCTAIGSHQGTDHSGGVAHPGAPAPAVRPLTAPLTGEHATLSKWPPGAWGQVSLALSLAAVAGAVIWLVYGPQAFGQYLSVYLVEQSLSADNLFVMYLIFQRFKVPLKHRSRVLTWGITSAAVLRVLMIATGGLSFQSVRWVSLLFAAVILQSGFSMLAPEEEEQDAEQACEANHIAVFIRRWLPVTAEYDGDRFFTRAEGSLKATPLFLVLLVIEFTDVVFSWDNVAAVFSCSTNMPLVWTATMLAIVSLRSWYSIIATVVSSMPALQTATGGILMFLGAKLIVEFFVPTLHISTYTTLLVIAGSLGTAVAVSLLTGNKGAPVAQAADR